MAQFLHKVQIIIKLIVVFILLFTTTYNLAQSIDIESKANELGMTKSSLEGLLNSAINNNGDGNPTPEAITERFFTGQAAGDNFGYSASSAGDVNGDGFDDFIVGAYFNDAGGSNSGSAYIYFGGIASVKNT